MFANPNMRLNFSKLKKLFKKNLSIFFTYLSILGIILVCNIIYVQAKIYTDIQQAESDYDHEVELDYGVPTLISEVSVPPSDKFSVYMIGGFYLKANFSNNNGSIWINDQNNETIWRDYLNEIIDTHINVNSSSILRYSLWANSSTLGNEILYFTFLPTIYSGHNFGLGVLIVFVPIIIGIVIVGVIFGKKKKEKVMPW